MNNESTSSFKCLNCGCEKCIRVRAAGKVAFAKDYQCVECKEQTAAPTPLWASLLFMFLGLPLACLGALWVYVNISSFHIIEIVIGSGMLAMGALSFRHGLLSILD